MFLYLSKKPYRSLRSSLAIALLMRRSVMADMPRLFLTGLVLGEYLLALTVIRKCWSAPADALSDMRRTFIWLQRHLLKSVPSYIVLVVKPLMQSFLILGWPHGILKNRVGDLALCEVKNLLICVLSKMAFRLPHLTFSTGRPSKSLLAFLQYSEKSVMQSALRAQLWRHAAAHPCVKSETL